MAGLDRRFVLQAGVAAAAMALTRQARAEGPDVPAGLIDGAKKEGQINVITLPRDWANWGTTMDRFQALYRREAGRRQSGRVVGRRTAGDP